MRFGVRRRYTGGMRRSHLFVSVSIALANVLVAQSTPSIESPEWRVPVHTGPVDPLFGDYGHWAAGEDFKASFGAEFSFYPRLGKRYPHNMPLTWRTTAITAGGAPWLSPVEESRVSFSDWRYERGHRGFVEVYDVLGEGVEQSFVLRERPATSGDVVVRGRITSELIADERGPAHAAIEFRAPATNEVLVRYGCAFAIDARGRKLEIESSFDGESIGLHVPGAWLADAAFPVTVDPILQTIVFGGVQGTVDVLDSDTAGTSWASSAPPALTVVSREFTTGDIDAFAYRYGDGSWNFIWQDVSPIWDTLRPRCAYSRGALRWVIAFERRTGTTAAVRVYEHNPDVSVVGSGTTYFMPGVPGESSLRPDVGGRTETSFVGEVMIVYEQGSTSSTNGNAIYARTLDLFAGSWGVPHLIDPGLAAQSKSVSIASSDYGREEWAVAFLVRAVFTTTWRPAVVRVGLNGVIGTRTVLGAGASADIDTTDVHLDGTTAHSMIAYREEDSSLPFVSRRACYQRFDWVNGVAQVRFDASLANGSFSTTVDVDSIAFDFDTKSHWCVLHRLNGALTATRTGFMGGITEQVSLLSDSYAPSVGWATDVDFDEDEWGAFRVTSAQPSPTFSLRSSLFGYPTTGEIPIGASCFGGTLAGTPDENQPLAGNANFSVTASGMPLGSQTFFLLSFTPASLPLDAIGATGCRLNVDPLTMVSLGTTASAVADPSFVVPLPDGFTGDVFLQALWIEPGINPLGLGGTNGLFMQVR